ncbi:MAG: acyltransferase [Planctomycetota bacterium]|jgi:acetyltransferase-like isoleucine patch superfamily enzyme
MQGAYIHPTAIVESDRIGRDTRIWAFAHVMAGATIGSNCNVGDHGFIEAGAVIGNNVTLKNHVCVWEGITIEDDVFVGPYVALTNDLYPRSPRMAAAKPRYDDKGQWLVRTTIEKGSTIGANATIVAGVRIGRYSMVGAGSVVAGDVEPFALAVGNPARKVGYVCRCGRRIGLTSPVTGCPECRATPDTYREAV